MSRKKISTTIYVTPEQNDLLKLLHDRTKVPVAVYIREGIDIVLRNYAHLLPGQLPLTSAQEERTRAVPPPTARPEAGDPRLRGLDQAEPRLRGLEQAEPRPRGQDQGTTSAKK